MHSTNDSFPKFANFFQYFANDINFTLASTSFPDPHPTVTINAGAQSFPCPSLNFDSPLKFDSKLNDADFTLAPCFPHSPLLPLTDAMAFNLWLNEQTANIHMLPQGQVSIHELIPPRYLSLPNQESASSAAIRKKDQQSARRRRSVRQDRSTKQRLNEAERYALLWNDEYIVSFNRTEVTCSGCMGAYKLDSRKKAVYYPGLWNKHKRRCPGIQDGIVSHLEVT
jgi:hypothetical protein